MTIEQIKSQIKAVEERQRWARIPESTKLAEEKRDLVNRLNNAIITQDKQRRFAAVNALTAQAAEALQQKEITAAEQKRLDFQVGQREVARASFMAANNGSDSGFDIAWSEIQTDLAKRAATEAARAYDPDGAVKAAVVGAVLAKYKR